MLDIIICEDNEHFKAKIYKEVDKFYKNINIKCNILLFEKYNQRLKNYINYKNDSNKLYILDICLKDNDSGIDIANDIRTSDYDSLIIFITNKCELIPEAQKLRLNIFDYIYKQVNLEQNINLVLNKTLEIFNLKTRLKFTYKRNDYNLKLNDIIYIMTDKSIRKTIVKTINNKYELYKPLNYFEEQLTKKFTKINRGCVVNVDNIEMIDYDKSIIKFNNGDKLLNSISNKRIHKLREVMKYDSEYNK